MVLVGARLLTGRAFYLITIILLRSIRLRGDNSLIVSRRVAPIFLQFHTLNVKFDAKIGELFDKDAFLEE